MNSLRRCRCKPTINFSKSRDSLSYWRSSASIASSAQRYRTWQL